MKHQIHALRYLWLAAVLALAGCAGTRAAYQAAENPVQKASVVAEHYYAIVREAADLKEAGAPAAAVAKLQAADRVAKPLVIELTRLAEAYKAVRSAENELALQKAMNEAVIALNAFIEALRSAR